MDVAVCRSDYPLHECVFKDDRNGLFRLLRSEDIAKKDVHGNTALHLALMLGRTKCVHMLLSFGAPIRIKNLAGWNSMAEAISYGDRSTIKRVLEKSNEQNKKNLALKREGLIAALNEIEDFYLEIKWNFHSWLPLVDRFLPSDLCKIYKRGGSVRMDSTLPDFSELKWERGDISFMFNAINSEKPLVILDNRNRVYHVLESDEPVNELNEEVDILMSSDIVSAQMSTKSIYFKKAQSGWIFKEDRKELIGPYSADYYMVNGLVVESKKRREHLSKEDLHNNRVFVESVVRGYLQGANAVDALPQLAHRESLDPPSPCGVTWEEYINSKPGMHPVLGRPHHVKYSSRPYKATVAMSPDFPLSVEILLKVLEAVSPFKHFTKLKEFIEMKLPPGFPIKLDIPLVTTISGKITFTDFKFMPNLDEQYFKIPDDYTEAPKNEEDIL